MEDGKDQLAWPGHNPPEALTASAGDGGDFCPMVAFWPLTAWAFVCCTCTQSEGRLCSLGGFGGEPVKNLKLLFGQTLGFQE